MQVEALQHGLASSCASTCRAGSSRWHLPSGRRRPAVAEAPDCGGCSRQRRASAPKPSAAATGSTRGQWPQEGGRDPASAEELLESRKAPTGTNSRLWHVAADAAPRQTAVAAAEGSLQSTPASRRRKRPRQEWPQKAGARVSVGFGRARGDCGELVGGSALAWEMTG